MGGVAVGFFTPAAIFRDPAVFCETALRSAAPSSRGFPMAIEQLKPASEALGTLAGDQNPAWREISPLSILVVSGMVPIHIDKPNKNERQGGVFWFIVKAINRPCLLAAAAAQDVSARILDPDNKQTFGLGAIELRGGMVVHIENTRQWMGITALPTGDPVPGEPGLIALQVPWPEPREIQRAIAVARQGLLADERYKDLVRK